MRTFSAILILALAAAIATAQQAEAPQQPQTFRSGVQTVEVDVRVFDRHGGFVEDLTSGDFEIVENGVPQTVQTLYLVRSRNSVQPRPTSSAELNLRGALRESGGSGSTSAHHIWIFFFDLHHIESGAALERARTAVHDFIRDRFQPGDVAGIVAGSRMVNNRLTSVREELVAAVNSLKPSGDARARKLDQIEAERRTTDDEAGEHIRQIEKRAVKAERERAAIETTNTLRALAMKLSSVAGPKTIVFFSDGFPAATVQAEPTLRTLAGQLLAANARFYPVDVRGLNFDMGAGDVAAAPINVNDVTVLPVPRVGIFEQDGGSGLANATGAFGVRAENNMGRAMDRIAADAGTYYVLGYDSTNSKFDGKFRRIDVRVKRDDVRVRARRGYMAVKPSRLLAPQPIR